MTTHTDLIARLRVIANAIADGNYSELTMRIPAEPDRDADIVVMRSALAIESLEQQVAALRVDAERLIWIEAQVAKGRFEIAKSLFGKGYEFGSWHPGPDARTHIGTLREAIDAAMGENAGAIRGLA